MNNYKNYKELGEYDNLPASEELDAQAEYRLDQDEDNRREEWKTIKDTHNHYLTLNQM